MNDDDLDIDLRGEPAVPTRLRSPWAAALLALLMPGLGQLHIGWIHLAWLLLAVDLGLRAVGAAAALPVVGPGMTLDEVVLGVVRVGAFVHAIAATERAATIPGWRSYVLFVGIGGISTVAVVLEGVR